MALDEATKAFLAAMAEAAPPGAPPLWELTPEQVRAATAPPEGAERPKGPDMARVEDVPLTGHDGGAFEVRVLVPHGEVGAIVVYAHGGGWVLESIDDFDRLGRMLAECSGSAVVLVGYRKAPEHPFPTPVEDVWSALEWAAAHAGEIAGAPRPLMVAGDSAGGNLAAVVAQRARDRGAPSLAAQVLVYPVTDADFGRGSYSEPENQTFLPVELMRWCWDHYLADEGARLRPEASPIRAESLAGLPPALVITGEHDVLRDEGEAYARRLADSGVEVRHRRWPGQMHAFLGMIDALPASREAIDYVSAFIGERSGSAPAAPWSDAR